MCKLNGETQNIEHYFNPGSYSRPVLLDSNNPTIGFSNSNTKLSDGVLTCSITRKKSMMGTENYFDISKNKYYILFAHGLINQSNYK